MKTQIFFPPLNVRHIWAREKEQKARHPLLMSHFRNNVLRFLMLSTGFFFFFLTLSKLTSWIYTLCFLQMHNQGICFLYLLWSNIPFRISICKFTTPTLTLTLLDQKVLESAGVVFACVLPLYMLSHHRRCLFEGKWFLDQTWILDRG